MIWKIDFRLLHFSLKFGLNTWSKTSSYDLMNWPLLQITVKMKKLHVYKPTDITSISCSGLCLWELPGDNFLYLNYVRFCFKRLTKKDSSVIHWLLILSIIMFIFNSGDDGRKFVSFVLLSILNVRVKKNINAWLFKCNANSGKPRQGVKTYGDSYSNREIRPNGFF